MRISFTACLPTTTGIIFMNTINPFFVSIFYVYEINFVEDYKGSNQIMEKKKAGGADFKLPHSQLSQ
jgi:hypothetical protein